MRFTFEQGRVLGSMIEKAMTTPANYPMSLNAVQVACNQVSNRDPIAELSEADIEMVLRGLADEGLAKMVHRPGDRVVKYRHALNDELQTSPQETALLAVLMLRGAQTPGELRQRTTRYAEFASLPEVEAVLDGLGRRDLVARLERQPGQKESRYRELLISTGIDDSPAEGHASAEGHAPAIATEPAVGTEPLVQIAEARDLGAELDELTRRFDDLLKRLGEEIQ